jgi:hypothetical protein
VVSIVGQQGKLTDAQVNHDDRAINKVKDRRAYKHVQPTSVKLIAIRTGGPMMNDADARRPVCKLIIQAA